MKFKMVVLILLAISMLVLAGCGQTAPAQTEEASSVSAPADTSSDGEVAPQRPGGDPSERGLTGMNLLNLGTLNLERTENAVTPEQAARLLPLWEMIQSGSLQSAAETDAVVKQIEGTMTEAQMAAIAAMGLTMDDVQVWMEAQGIALPARGEGQGGPGNFQNMSQEERAAMREKLQNMTPEEREAALAEMGVAVPEGAGEGGFGGGMRGGGVPGGAGGNAMLQPLIDLLAARAAE